MKKFLVFLVLIMILYFIQQISTIKTISNRSETFLKEIQIPKLALSVSCQDFKESLLKLTSGIETLKGKASSVKNLTLLRQDKEKLKEDEHYNLKLLGIVLWKGDFYALLSCNSQLFFAREGEVLCGDIKVKKVSDSYVVVKVKDREEKLKIFNCGV